MRILIITYTREVNPGTFLQAYGVQYGLKLIFPTAQIEFIKHERLYSFLGTVKHEKKIKDLTYIKSKLLAIPRRIKYEYLYKKMFSFSKEQFNFFNYDEKKFLSFTSQYDLICVGSDTILINFEQKGRIGLMWLKDVLTPKIFFAVSAAPANYTIPTKYVQSLHDTFLSALQIGVRDEVTENMLIRQLQIPESRIYLQPDPTYLIPDSSLNLSIYFKSRFKIIKRKAKIALVNFSEGFVFKSQITNKIKKKGYYIISTHYNKDADWNIMTLSPFEWGALFRYVDLTVTDRFHDSVFTLRNNKNVFAIDWDKERFSANGLSKTNSLLKYYGLSDYHFIVNSTNDLQKLFYALEKFNDIEKITSRVNNSISEFYTTYLHRITDLINTTK